MEGIKMKYRNKVRSKAANVKLNITNKLFKTKCKRRFISPSPMSKSFFCRRNQTSRVPKKQQANTKENSLRAIKRNIRKIKNTPRLTAKSPVPKHNLRVTLPQDEEYEREEMRYVAIIKKANRALDRSPRGFHSPCLLKKFLSTWKSMKSQDSQAQRSKNCLSPEQRIIFNSSDGSQDFEDNEPQSFSLGKNWITFSACKDSYKPKVL
ncbi:unnamed protein product [Moneuplotes crassus]|uniref:Uncharacterized protein n=1 Tax=Euplotes crassus TaxID=5936 RepID=A0AAD1UCL0_EUPCR|nr:unnamed protein product [Moneuplotes crassus]